MKLLEEIDELLAMLEDTAHGSEGKRITEMRYRIQTELSNLHKHGVVRGGVIEAQSVQLREEDLKWVNSCVTQITPTEPLPAEGREKRCADGHWFATEYMNQRPARCIVCGHIEL